MTQLFLYFMLALVSILSILNNLQYIGYQGKHRLSLDTDIKDTAIYHIRLAELSRAT